MKQKQHNLFIICSSIIVVIISTIYCYYSLSLNNAIRLKRSFNPLPDIKAPSNPDMQVVRQLENKLPGIAYPVFKENPPVNMQIFGISSYSNSVSKETKKTPVIQKTDPGYSVTFALKSGRNGLCSINKKMYKVGDSLPCGSIIEKVESHRVSIRKNNISKWLYVVNK